MSAVESNHTSTNEPTSWATSPWRRSASSCRESRISSKDRTAAAIKGVKLAKSSSSAKRMESLEVMTRNIPNREQGTCLDL